MQISIHRLAEPELSEAAEYYSQSRKSLGKEFLDEFDAAVLKIVENPLASPKVSGDRRRKLMHLTP